MPKVIKLKKPLQTHSGEAHEITLRDVSGSDFMHLNKMPFQAQGQGESATMKVDFQVASAWLTRLSGVDEILLGKLGADDFMNLVTSLGEHLGDQMGGASAGNS